MLYQGPTAIFEVPGHAFTAMRHERVGYPFTFQWGLYPVYVETVETAKAVETVLTLTERRYTRIHTVQDFIEAVHAITGVISQSVVGREPAGVQ